MEPFIVGYAGWKRRGQVPVLEGRLISRSASYHSYVKGLHPSLGGISELLSSRGLPRLKEATQMRQEDLFTRIWTDMEDEELFLAKKSSYPYHVSQQLHA